MQKCPDAAENAGGNGRPIFTGGIDPYRPAGKYRPDYRLQRPHQSPRSWMPDQGVCFARDPSGTEAGGAGLYPRMCKRSGMRLCDRSVFADHKNGVSSYGGSGSFYRRPSALRPDTDTDRFCKLSSPEGSAGFRLNPMPEPNA